MISRRNFLLGAAALPIAAKAAAVDAVTIAAPVAEPLPPMWTTREVLVAVERSIFYVGWGEPVMWSDQDGIESWDRPPITFKRPPPFSAGGQAG